MVFNIQLLAVYKSVTIEKAIKTNKENQTILTFHFILLASCLCFYSAPVARLMPSKGTNSIQQMSSIRHYARCSTL